MSNIGQEMETATFGAREVAEEQDAAGLKAAGVLFQYPVRSRIALMLMKVLGALVPNNDDWRGAMTVAFNRTMAPEALHRLFDSSLSVLEYSRKGNRTAMIGLPMDGGVRMLVCNMEDLPPHMPMGVFLKMLPILTEEHIRNHDVVRVREKEDGSVEVLTPGKPNINDTVGSC